MDHFQKILEDCIVGQTLSLYQQRYVVWNLRYKIVINLSKIINHNLQTFKSWVKSRVFEIQRLTDKLNNSNISWFHCPGHKNIADVNTRPYLSNTLPWESDFDEDFCLNEMSENLEISDLPEHDKRLIYSNSDPLKI